MVARTNRARPAGFTLIELLVVIAIIGVLMGLLLAAVMRVTQVGDEAKVKSDLRQMDVDINAFKAKYGVDHLPAFGHQDSNPANWATVNPNRYFRLLPKYDGSIPAASAQNAPTDTTCFEWQYLNRIFPGLNPSNTGLPALNLDCNQTMVFFLTGGVVTNYTGFSTDTRFPFDTTNMNNRKGKFFDIPDNRIQMVGGQTTGRYLDPWGTPYIYMAPYDGKQYPTPTSAATDVIPQAVLVQMGVVNPPTGINPFRSFVSGTATKALKDGSFQIVSAGKNKVFGRGSFFVSPGVFAPYAAGTSPYSDKDPGGDDFSNFNSLKLSAGNN